MTRLNHIWCPACGCDVKELLSNKLRTDTAAIRAKEVAYAKAVSTLRAVVLAMEAHAQAKGDRHLSVQDIYRQWSEALFTEIAQRVPDYLRGDK